MERTKNETAKMRELIRRLLALAGNNPNEHEAAAALAKAQELMTKWNIQAGEVGMVAEEINVGASSWTSPQPVAWKLQAFCSAADLFYCKVAVTNRAPGVTYHLVGRAPNRDAAMDIFGWILGAAESAWNERRLHGGTVEGNVVIAKRSFALGFVLGAFGEMRRVQLAQAAQVRAVAIRTQEENDQWVAENWGKLGKGRPSRPTRDNYAEFGRGQRAGRAASDGRIAKVSA